MAIKMMKYQTVFSLLISSLAIPMAAQTPATQGIVACKLSIEGSQTMKDLYGGKVPLYAGNVTCKNYASVTVGPIGAADLYLALGTINTMTAADASALLTKTYSRSVASQAGTAVQSANTGLGLLAGLKQLSISASSLGWIGFGVGIFSQAVLPFFTAGQPNLTSLLANQCDSMSNVSLAPGQSISCTIYIQKPPKKTVLPGAVPFDLVPSGPPTPGSLPPPAPVQLRPRVITEVKPFSTESGIEQYHVTETHQEVAKIESIKPVTRDAPQSQNSIIIPVTTPPSSYTVPATVTDSERIDALQRQMEATQKQLAMVQAQLQVMTDILRNGNSGTNRTIPVPTPN